MKASPERLADDNTQKMATLERIAINYQALMLFCVDYYDKLSNLFEDLVKLDMFVQSVENELNPSPQ